MLRSKKYAILLTMLAALFATTLRASAQSDFVNTMMPLPAEVHASPGSLVLSPQTTFRLDAPPCDPLHDATLRMITRIQNQTGIQFTERLNSTSGPATITVKVSDVSKTLPNLDDDESYHIDVDNNSATISAQTVFGAYDALETFQQLVQPQSGHFAIPNLHIKDSPRFPWRGLLLDPGRHFLPVSTILRTLDGMAAVKLNVLHLHLTENQGFRIESHRFPKLTGMGSEGMFYTQQQMREIIKYAADRGIRVVPEFDMPGHSTSWMVGYPELGSAPGPYKVERGFGIFDAAMDPTRESTYKFIDEFMGEMVQIFPDQYVHIGGDESNGKEWRNNPSIQAFMKAHHMADTKALQAYFNKRVQAILHKYHRTMIGWDEVLHPDLSPDVVIHNWHGVQFLIDAAKQGHKGLFSKPYYLDHSYTAGQMFATDPIPSNAGLTAEQKKLILGGEACMWGERVVESTIDSRIWPRTIAVAERLWSPQDDRDKNDMYRRLRVESLRLDALEIQHLSGPQRLLRQIAGKEVTPALDTFAAALQPAERSHLQHNTRDTPMTGFVDAARFDPPLRHAMALMVNTYLNGNEPAERDEARTRLEALFHAWIATGPKLDELAQRRPQLNTVELRRHQLVQLGQLGLEAIAAHEQKHNLDSTQAENADQLLETAAEPNDELVDFAVIGPLHTLVGAVEAKK